MNGRARDARKRSTATHARPSTIGLEVRALLEPFAVLVGEVVAAELRGCGTEASEARYYTAQTSPLPTKAFLAAARAGSFPSFVIKRRVYALRDDVHRFMESSLRPIRAATTTADDDEIGRLLDDANVRPRRRRP